MKTTRSTTEPFSGSTTEIFTPQQLKDASLKYNDSFVRAAFEYACRINFEAMCVELKAMGVEKVWLGRGGPDRVEFFGSDENIFVSPPTKLSKRVWIASWVWDVVSKYFPTGCGNGRDKWIQAQNGFLFPKAMLGEYVL